MDKHITYIGLDVHKETIAVAVAHGCQTGTDQIAHRFMGSVRNPYRRQRTSPMQPRQIDRVPPVRLDPVPGLRGINDGATTT